MITPSYVIFAKPIPSTTNTQTNTTEPADIVEE